MPSTSPLTRLALLALLTLPLAGCTEAFGAVPPLMPASSPASGAASSSASPDADLTPSAGVPDAGAAHVPSAGGVRFAPTAHGRLDGKTVVVDPGHNGRFVHGVNNNLVPVFGARPQRCQSVGGTGLDGKTTEHALVWDIAQRLVPQLRAEGATVIVTRPDDAGTGPCNDERAAIADRNHADLLVSIHADGALNPRLRGFGVLTPAHSAGGDALGHADREAALTMVDALRHEQAIPVSNYLSTDHTGVRPEDLSVLNNLAHTRGLLIETANMVQADDWAILSAPGGRQRLAEALRTGIERILA